jgi:hypothetical protein
MRGLALACALGCALSVAVNAGCVAANSKQLPFCANALKGYIVSSRETPQGNLDWQAFQDARQVCQADRATRYPNDQLQVAPNTPPYMGLCFSNDLWDDGRTPEQRMREGVSFSMAGTTCVERLTRLTCAIHAGNKGASYYNAVGVVSTHDTEISDCPQYGALEEPSATDCCKVLESCNVQQMPKREFGIVRSYMLGHVCCAAQADAGLLTLSEWCTLKVWNDGKRVQCSGGSVAHASALLVMAAFVLLRGLQG